MRPAAQWMSCSTPPRRPRRAHAQARLHPGAPERRQVPGLDPPRDEVALQFEAKDDVEVVGGLVGLDPDEARRDGVDGAVEGLQGHVVQHPRERPAQRRIVVPPEGRERPMRFSQSRDWDSWSPVEQNPPAGSRKRAGSRPCS